MVSIAREKKLTTSQGALVRNVLDNFPKEVKARFTKQQVAKGITSDETPQKCMELMDEVCAYNNFEPLHRLNLHAQLILCRFPMHRMQLSAACFIVLESNSIANACALVSRSQPL